MNERPNLPTVKKGEPITADAMNRIVERVNAREEQPAPTRRAPTAKGEFWLQNLTGETIPAFSIVGLRGFANVFESIAKAKSALARDEIVFKSTSPSLAYPLNWGFALEGIRAGGVGRATFLHGPLVFGEVSGADSVSTSSRFTIPSSGANANKLTVDAEGWLINVAFDSPTRFAAACAFQNPPIKYQAGSGLSLVGATFHANPAFQWGVWTGSAYALSGSINCDGAGKLCFSPQFERGNRRDDASGGELKIKTTTKTVVTGVDFNNGTVTTAQITVLQ